MSFTRRKFITTAATATALSPLVSLDKPILERNPGFSLKILATNWGFNGNYDAFCAKAKSAGYDGVEVWLPGSAQERDELMNATSKHGLGYGFLWGSGESDFVQHFDEFSKMLEIGVALKPLYFNCHSGKDWLDYDLGTRLVREGFEISRKSGVPVYHETHRGRLLYAAHVTKKYLENIPGIRLTLDISHWCAVHESLLWDQKEAVDLALENTDHIHARIGHAEGPQVNDPRAPEWKDAVNAHFGWWDKIVKKKAEAGQSLTILTEFGPPTYLPTVPYTFQPLADQWDINVYMMKTLRERYSR